ncbi:TetR/AcrR family transcriptional regulator [Alicyclobacillaceae bacterium I2511]|jgi:AcrR family transcriptional regulator|nr:TetR/AcrR family transcriptional regulator [Alicyclobacillaceae bacterium I2511]
MKDTKESIIEGARIVFAQKGFRTTIKDIAKAAGLASPSLVFWYFKDKQQLLLEVASTASPLSHFENSGVFQPTVDPLEQLQTIGTAYLQIYSDPLERQILFQLIGNSAASLEIRQVLQQQVATVITHSITECIVRGQQSKEICSHLDPEFLGQSFFGTLYSLVTRWEVDGYLPWTPEALVRQLVTLLRCPHNDSVLSCDVS